jgi:hypothetical protein
VPYFPVANIGPLSVETTSAPSRADAGKREEEAMLKKSLATAVAVVALTFVTGGPVQADPGEGPGDCGTVGFSARKRAHNADNPGETFRDANPGEATVLPCVFDDET